MVARIFILGQMHKDGFSLEPFSFRTRELPLSRMLDRASASSDAMFCKIDSKDIYYINKCAHIRHRLAYPSNGCLNFYSRPDAQGLTFFRTLQFQD